MRERAEKGLSKRVGLIVPTVSVARDVAIEGEAGLLNICPPWKRPEFQISKRRLTWPNGVRLTYYPSDQPELMRGMETDLLWIEELCALRNPSQCYAMAKMGNRIGEAKTLVSTTPKKNHPVLNILLKRAAEGKASIVRGSTYENATNLAEEAVSDLMDMYGGTRLGLQELSGEVLADTDGAYWTEEQLDHLRRYDHPPLVKVAVGVDPAISTNRRSDETGIVVAGRCAEGRAWILGDYSSDKGPSGWGHALVDACRSHGATGLKVETVRGGNLIVRNIAQIFDELEFALPPIEEINSQELDKLARIELFVGLFEQSKAFMVGRHPKLEKEMTDWSPKESKYSPNRIDAMVMALDLLFPERSKPTVIIPSERIEVARGSYAPKRRLGRL